MFWPALLGWACCVAYGSRVRIRLNALDVGTAKEPACQGFYIDNCDRNEKPTPEELYELAQERKGDLVSTRFSFNFTALKEPCNAFFTENSWSATGFSQCAGGIFAGCAYAGAAPCQPTKGVTADLELDKAGFTFENETVANTETDEDEDPICPEGTDLAGKPPRTHGALRGPISPEQELKIFCNYPRDPRREAELWTNMKRQMQYLIAGSNVPQVMNAFGKLQRLDTIEDFLDAKVDAIWCGCCWGRDHEISKCEDTSFTAPSHLNSLPAPCPDLYKKGPEEFYGNPRARRSSARNFTPKRMYTACLPPSRCHGGGRRKKCWLSVA